MLLTCPLGGTIEGQTQATFVVDVPFSKVVHRMDTMESLQRALRSQGINLQDHKLTKREFDLWTQTVDAEANIKSRVPRISTSVAGIRQTMQVGLSRATIEFALQEPIGLVAEQHYVLEFEAQEKQTQIRIQMYTKVNVPWSRLRSVRRLINRIAHRRLANEICRNRASLKREITEIVTEERPKDAQSILFP